MVHALDGIRTLLRPGGVLIDIHPVREAPLLEVHDGRVVFSEPYAGYDYEEDLRHADDALVSAIERGLFRLDRDLEFDLVTYARSVTELRAHFAVAGAYDDGVQDAAAVMRSDQQYAEVEEIRTMGGRDAEVALRERARMTRLLPSDPNIPTVR